MTQYRIANWNERYENNRSRLVKRLDWVPVPNNHDSEGYARIITHKRGAEIFAAWILLLQVASRCEPRGELVSATGTPHTFETLALKTRAPRKWFEIAVPFLESVGWVSRNSISSNNTAPACHPTDVHDGTDLSTKRREEKGREWKEGKEGKEARAAVAAPVSDFEWLASLRTDPAFEGINVDLEHAKMIAWCRENKRQPNRRRFVNWLNRCDRPLNTGAMRVFRQPPPIPEPPNWQRWIDESLMETCVYRTGGESQVQTWAQLPRDVQKTVSESMRKTA